MSTEQPHPPLERHGGARPLSPSDERTWAILAHVSPLVLAAITVGTLGFIAPLVIWLVLRERSTFVDDQAKEALNFQITVAIVGVVGMVLRTIFGWIPLLGGLVSGIVWVVLTVVWIATIVLAVIAAITAARHEAYRYPFTLRLVK
jgi:uncharacterized Tic20 family protein